MVTLIIWGNDENGYWESRGKVFRNEVETILENYTYDGYEIA